MLVLFYVTRKSAVECWTRNREIPGSNPLCYYTVSKLALKWGMSHLNANARDTSNNNNNNNNII